MPQRSSYIPQVIESVREQEAIISIAGKHILRMGEIANVSCTMLRINVDALASANLVAAKLRIRCALDFKYVAGDVLAISLHELQRIVAIDGSATLKTIVIRERVRAP